MIEQEILDGIDDLVRELSADPKKLAAFEADRKKFGDLSAGTWWGSGMDRAAINAALAKVVWPEDCQITIERRRW